MDCAECEDCEAHDATLRWFSCRWTGGQIADIDLSSGRPCPLSMFQDGALSLPARMACKAILWQARERGLFEELLLHYNQSEREFLRALLMEVSAEHRRATRRLEVQA